MLSAPEAADRLGVKVDTLYAYVSRGLLRSMEVVGSRERHYDAEEVERFRVGRGTTRARPPAEDLVPVIGSAICLIDDHRLFYRGHDALRLAETATLEDVAAILWEGEGAISAASIAVAAPHPPIADAMGPSLSPQAGRGGLTVLPLPAGGERAGVRGSRRSASSNAAKFGWRSWQRAIWRGSI